MEKFKRVLCVTLAGVMSCSVLGACGQKEVKETKTITWLMPGDKQSEILSFFHMLLFYCFYSILQGLIDAGDCPVVEDCSG